MFGERACEIDIYVRVHERTIVESQPGSIPTELPPRHVEGEGKDGVRNVVALLYMRVLRPSLDGSKSNAGPGTASRDER